MTSPADTLQAAVEKMRALGVTRFKHGDLEITLDPASLPRPEPSPTPEVDAQDAAQRKRDAFEAIMYAAGSGRRVKAP